MFFTSKKTDNPPASRLWNFTKRMTVRIFSIYFYKNYFRWNRLKDKYKGKRVFLIGNGPSLNKTPLYLLKDEYTMTFNRFRLMFERLNWTQTFFVLDDTGVFVDNQDDVEFMKNVSDYCFFRDDDYRKYNSGSINKLGNVLLYHIEPMGFSTNLPFLGSGSTVPYEGLEILNYLGFDEIYIIGADMDYILHENSTVLQGKHVQVVKSNADDDPNHFDPRYFGKGKVLTQPTESVIQAMFAGFQKASEYFKTTNKIVKNLGYDSKLNCFEKEDFGNILGYTKEQISDLFEDLIKTYNFDSLNCFLESSLDCENIYEWDNERKVISLPTDIAVNVIKSRILYFIPIGPYDGKIYFIKR